MLFFIQYAAWLTLITPASNGRFCEMATLHPQTILCEYEIIFVQ